MRWISDEIKNRIKDKGNGDRHHEAVICGVIHYERYINVGQHFV